MKLLTLQNFEILDIGIFRVHVELHSRHGKIHVDTVEDLAESGAIPLGQPPISKIDTCVLFFWPSRSGGGVQEDIPSTTLLNLCDVELKQAVQPCYKLLSVRDVVLLAHRKGGTGGA